MEVIQGALTRHFPGSFGEIYDEMKQAFNDEIPLTEGSFHIRYRI